MPEEVKMEVPLAYYGFASVENGPIFKALITTLPNGKTLDENGYATVNMVSRDVYIICSVVEVVSCLQEVYILNEFESDFYGKSLRLWILGRLEEDEPVAPPCVTCREKDLKKMCKEHSYIELQIQLLEAALSKVDSILDASTLEEYRHIMHCSTTH